MTTTGLLAREDAAAEVDRLTALISTEVGPTNKALVLVSGGLDSDVVARLACRAVSSRRLKLATAIQDDMDPLHLANAQALAGDMQVDLVEVDVRGLNLDVLYRMAAADRAEAFAPDGLLDPARMKCSLRTVLASSYQDRGYVILGASNRTEVQLGFFLPFGDGVWHVGPIAHLYKTEVRLIAREVGTSTEVLSQPPSAGFWRDQTDREDLGFWLVNRGPIRSGREFTAEEVELAATWSSRLDEAAVDLVLLALADGRDPHATMAGAELGREVVDGLVAIVSTSAGWKNRPTGVTVERRKELHR